MALEERGDVLQRCRDPMDVPIGLVAGAGCGGSAVQQPHRGVPDGPG